jgi:hypothetical protein
LAFQNSQSFATLYPEGYQPKPGKRNNEQVEVRIPSLKERRGDDNGRKEIPHNKECYHLSPVQFRNPFGVGNGH